MVDELAAPELEQLARHQPGGVTDALGLGLRGLQAAEFLDNLVQQHDDVAAR